MTPNENIENASTSQRAEPRVSTAAAARSGAAKKTSRRKKVLALGASLLVALVVCEVALRLFWHNPYRFETPDKVVWLRVQHPNTHHVFNRAAVDPEHPLVQFRSDERGYLLPSFQFDKPDATVAFLGGSTTECSMVAEDLRFPALVSQLLSEQGRKVNTLNAGRSGSTLHDSLNVLLNHVVRDRPDIVVLMHAANDIGVLKHDGDYRSRMGKTVSWPGMAKWTAQSASS